MQPRRTKHVGGQDTEVDHKQPEQRPVDPRATGLQPEDHRIERQGDDIGMCLRAVAEQNHKTRQHGKGLYSETEVAPTLIAPEEGCGQQGKHCRLHESVVRQQEGFQASCKEDADKVGVVMVTANHIEHLLIENEDIVEGRIDSWQQEESYTAEDSIAQVAPHLRIAEQDGQFRGTINFRGGRQHDEEHSPETFAAFQEYEGKDIDISYYDVVLVAEYRLQDH